ncbi:zinc finger protein [Trichuris trichiura]|uniref:Zinc finger protein n=1 Tax=Trichuris trichiura TaxID=36087 RepID=A0A077Z8N2_TRITR|nr:zinc finger protein [Trichuris trichiura]
MAPVLKLTLLPGPFVLARVCPSAYLRGGRRLASVRAWRWLAMVAGKFTAAAAAPLLAWPRLPWLALGRKETSAFASSNLQMSDPVTTTTFDDAVNRADPSPRSPNKVDLQSANVLDQDCPPTAVVDEKEEEMEEDEADDAGQSQNIEATDDVEEYDPTDDEPNVASATAAAVDNVVSASNVASSMMPSSFALCKSTVCGECGTMIKNAANLEVHMRRHLQYRPYYCIHCEYKGYDVDDVGRHTSRAHPEKPQNLNFKPTADLENRVKEMISACRKIGGGATTLSSVPVSKGSGFDMIDPSSFAGISSADCMQLTETGDMDPNCSSFANVSSLMMGSESQRMFSGLLYAALASLDLDNLKCGYCSEMVANKPDAILRHVFRHVRFNRFGCSFCGSVTSTLAQYEAHLQRMHSEYNLSALMDQTRHLIRREASFLVETIFLIIGQIAKLTCSLCDEKVMWRWNSLLAHVRQHEGGFPYQCLLCNSPFVDQVSVLQHLQCVHGGRSANASYSTNWGTEEVVERHLSKCFPIFASDKFDPIIDNLFTDCDTTDGGGTVFTERADEKTLNDSTKGLDQLTGCSARAPTKSTLYCNLCQAKISRNMSCLIAHAKVHLAYKPLKCEYCNFRHFAMSKIRRHNTRVHGSKPVRVSYHPVPDIGKQIKQMKLECFGITSSGGTQNRSSLIEDDSLFDDVPPECASSEGEQTTTTTAGGDSAVGEKTSALLDRRSPASKENLYIGSDLLQNFLVPTDCRYGNSGGDHGDGVVVKKETAYLTEPCEMPGLGKKICCLCSTYIANNPSSFENHACKHLDYKPYHCHYCTYQSYIRGKVTRHIQQVHSGLPVKIIHKPVPGIKDRIISMKFRCFPFLAGFPSDRGAPGASSCGSGSVSALHGGGNSGSNADGSSLNATVTCQLCLQNVLANDTAFNDHLSAHISHKFFHCPVCTYATNFLIRAKQHVHSAHPHSQETRIICCPPDGMKGLQELRVKCFGNMTSNPGTTTRDTTASGGRGRRAPAGSDESKVAPIVGVRSSTSPVNNSNDKASSSTDSKNPVDSGNNSNGKANITLCGQESAAIDCAADQSMTCQICSEAVCRQLSSLVLHARQHLDHKPFQCAYCSWKSQEEEDVKQHITRSHRNVPLKVLFHPERTMVSRIVQRCFPALSNLDGNGSQLLLSGGSSPNSTISGISPVVLTPGTPNASTILRKLVCKLCNGSIADNPKSIGIHVKNHLNYKPYRCPYCRYMSCEQSKARRHVEHVHNISGDAIEIHAEENIKEKITDMKARCFPNLGQVSLGDFYTCDELTVQDLRPMLASSKRGLMDETLDHREAHAFGDGDSVYECRMCHDKMTLESVENHVRTHLGKMYRCPHCNSRFWTEEKVKFHIQTVHPNVPPQKVLFQEEDVKKLVLYVRKRCFPEVESSRAQNYDESLLSNGSGVCSKRARLLDDSGLSGIVSPEGVVSDLDAFEDLLPEGALSCGRLLCHVCKQAVLVHRSSWEIHVTKHLKFKAHHCSCCNFKAYTAVRVKSHVQSAHPDRECHVNSLGDYTPGLKEVLTDMRALCFPVGSPAEENVADVGRQVEDLRLRLAGELEALATSFGGTSPTDEGKPTEIKEEGNVDDSAGSQANLAGKMRCLICSAAISPSSLGLHVRNHLDYKPFHCKLCDYKSCLLARVRQHLQSAHQCQDLEVVYKSEPDIRQKLATMRRRCFPDANQDDSLDLALDSMEASDGSDVDDGLDGGSLDGDSSTISSNGAMDFESAVDDSNDCMREEGMQSISSLMNSMLGVSTLNEEEMDTTQATSSGEKADAALRDADDRDKTDDGLSEVECQICGERIVNGDLTRTKHLTRHLGDYEFRCYYCEFSSFVQTETLKHVTAAHAGSPVRVARSSLGTKQISAAYERLSQQCFPKGSNTPKITASASQSLSARKGTSQTINQNVMCAICSVSMQSSDDEALLNHVRYHLRETCFKCNHCDFLHLQSSVVKEHTRGVHPGKSSRILTMTGDENDDLELWKTWCFPEWNTYMSEMADAELDELEELEEADDDEDAEDEASVASANGAALKRGSSATRVLSADGPRYICQLCKSPVSMYASSLYVHVKNHMNYKPYCCGHCDYKSPVKSKVRRHIQNAHKGLPATINYFPTPGIDHEVLRWKKRCFPEVTSFATLANDKVPCLLCKTDVADTLLSKSVHAKNHLDSKPYHCGYCPYRSCLRGETRRHVVRQHIGLPVNIVFKEPEVAAKEKVNRMIEQCFGTPGTTRGPSSRTTSSQNKDKQSPEDKSLCGDASAKMVAASNSKNNNGNTSTEVASGATEPDTSTKSSNPVSSSLSTSGYNLRTTRSSTIRSAQGTSSSQTAATAASSLASATSSSSASASKKGESSGGKNSGSMDVRLGQAYRVWHCRYCNFMAHSKYSVKQHCLGEHPGKPVEVLNVNRDCKK